MTSADQTSTEPPLTAGLGVDHPRFGRVLDFPHFPVTSFLNGWTEATPFNPANDGSIHRWHRIFIGLLSCSKSLVGPTLDVASGAGLLYPPLRTFLPGLLPYSITELNPPPELTIGGDRIPALAFECERDRLPAPDHSFGQVLFCDVIEHLMVDPVWTLLEFNRVLRIGGHVLISTPNVVGFERALRIMSGFHPGDEHHYKPSDLFQRHNREWTPRELGIVLTLLGFEPVWTSTFPDLYPLSYNDLFVTLNQAGAIHVSKHLLGPDIVFIAKKISHMTIDDQLPQDTRWPAFLYTGYSNYRRRPEVYPFRER